MAVSTVADLELTYYTTLWGASFVAGKTLQDLRKEFYTSAPVAFGSYATPADRTSNTVLTGCIPATSGTLTSTIVAGTAYVGGVRILTTDTPHTFTALTDTYLDLSATKVYTYVEVANGAAIPAVTAGCVRTGIVVTSATAITSVVSMATNIAMGNGALANPGTAWGTVAIGHSALQNNAPTAVVDTGLYNTAVGYRAMQANTSGNHCTAIGFSALQNQTSGISNTGIGEDAFLGLTTGHDCVAVGAHAAYTQTSAFDTTAIGSMSLGYLTTGQNNTAVGASTGIATFAGVGNCTTDDSMVFIGTYASVDKSVNVGPFTNSVALGARAKVDVSNMVQLGANTTTTMVRTSGDYETTVVGKGFVLKSPDGTRYRVTVANGGALSTVAA